jgi:hypothetical protein
MGDIVLGDCLRLLPGWAGQQSSFWRNMEERKAQFAMAPVLQAEEDCWYHAREIEIAKKEAEIMKNVPEWIVGESTYLMDRCVPRQIAPMDKNLKK